MKPRKLKLIVGSFTGDIVTTFPSLNRTYQGFISDALDSSSYRENLRSAIQAGIGLYDESIWFYYDDNSSSMAFGAFESIDLTNYPIGAIPLKIYTYAAANADGNSAAGDVYLSSAYGPTIYPQGLNLGSGVKTAYSLYTDKHIYVTDVHGGTLRATYAELDLTEQKSYNYCKPNNSKL